MRRTNLRGHALRSEGKPYARGDEGGWVRVSFGQFTGSGIGVALCECGAASEPLTSNSVRKHWHRLHKDAVRGALVGHHALAEEWNPDWTLAPAALLREWMDEHGWTRGRYPGAPVHGHLPRLWPGRQRGRLKR